MDPIKDEEQTIYLVPMLLRGNALPICLVPMLLRGDALRDAPAS